jgi:hypothetical protein
MALALYEKQEAAAEQVGTRPLLETLKIGPCPARKARYENTTNKNY